MRRMMLGAVTVAIALGLAAPAQAERGGRHLEIDVLSNRADLVSGGNALVEVVLPNREDPDDVRLKLNGSDVSAEFALRPDGRFLGLISGLGEGRNVLTARGRRGADRITITNHPIGGPIFSGPQVQPWICETELSGLGPPLDGQCNAPAKVEYFYRSTDPATGGFQPYSPEDPPSDVASTETDEGETVPYVVRVETGTLNRGTYQVGALHDPDDPVAPWAADRIWNGKLLYLFLGGGSPAHRQGAPEPVLEGVGDPMAPGNGYQAELALSRGWAVAAASLNRGDQNTNFITSAEAVMMTKERITESLGEIRYTVGVGESGGSVQQHEIAELYPGLLNGIQPWNSHEEWLTSNYEVLDCHLLDRAYEASPELWSDQAQRAAVSGEPDPAGAPPTYIGTCNQWIEWSVDELWSGPHVGCTVWPPPIGDGIEPPWVYDPIDNPAGARCTLPDYQVAQFGRRPRSDWGPIERQTGRGFANRPYDNVGVEYGLEALSAGRISAEQFVDLNEEIGGYDHDLNWHTQRTEADPYALEVAYRSAVIHGRQLAKVPMIDLRGTENYGLHPDYRSYAMRGRLDLANGHHDNQVIWVTGPRPLVPPDDAYRDAFLLIDEWLAAIEADDSGASLEHKVRRNKPAGAGDGCWIDGQKHTDPAICREHFPRYGNSRMVAGGPITDDVYKCRLKPLRHSDHEVAFSDGQWQRLRATFPDGVCDYSRPSVAKRPTVPWLTFAGGPGGKRLGPDPGG